MMTTLTQTLLKLAKEAHELCFYDDNKESAAFYRAANPATIIKLCEALDEAEKALREIQEQPVSMDAGRFGFITSGLAIMKAKEALTKIEELLK